MKKLMLGAAGLAAMIAAPAALADTTGHVDAAYHSLDGGSADYDAFRFAGAFATDLGGGWGAQVNASSLRVDTGSSSDLTANLFGGHLYYGDGGGYRIGGFVASENYSSVGIWSYGIDGQLNINSITLTGNIATNDIDAGSVDSYTSAHAQGTFFLNENFGITGSVGFQEDNALLSDDLTTLGISGEFQFASAPVSIFGGYNNADVGSSSDLDRFIVGIRYNFGGGSLMERTHNGPSLLSGSGFFDDIY